MLRGNVEEGSIFLPLFPSYTQCMNNPNPAPAINTNLYCFRHKSSVGYMKMTKSPKALDGFRHQISAYICDISALQQWNEC